MHAVIVTFTLPKDSLENATAGITESTRMLPQTPGFQQGYWVYDNESEKMLAVVLFESEDHARASWVQAESDVRANIEATGGVMESRISPVVHQV